MRRKIFKVRHIKKAKLLDPIIDRLNPISD